MIRIKLPDNLVITNDNKQFIINKPYENKETGETVLQPIKFYPDTHSLLNYLRHHYVFTFNDDIVSFQELVSLNRDINVFIHSVAKELSNYLIKEEEIQ